MIYRTILTGVLILILSISSAVSEGRTKIILNFDASFNDGMVSGKVYVFFYKNKVSADNVEPSLVKPDPFFVMNIKNWLPGQKIKLTDQNSAGFPMSISELKTGHYMVRGILDISGNSEKRIYPQQVGNGYSNLSDVNLSNDKVILINIVHEILPKEFHTTRFIKEAKLESALLSRFRKKKVIMTAAVILPKSYYSHVQKKFPVVYIITGFGLTHYEAEGYKNTYSLPNEIDKIYIVLDADCPLGHHEFADSENNGPRG